jgi:RNA polymerase sigma-70 factor (ECF subfamily)
MNSANTESPSASPDAQARMDSELVKRIGEGDKAALASLYDRFSRPLYAMAFRILNDTGEAEDIVHDVFVSLWSHAKEFDAARGSAFSWVVTLTRNRSIDRIRSRRRRLELLEESFPADLGYGANEDFGSSIDQLWHKEKATVVRAALGQLPADQRSAVELAFFSGLTQQEIAAKLQEPLGTVKARIRRGLLKLRDQLAHRL